MEFLLQPSPPGSPSPSSDETSSNPSPASQNTPLSPLSMARSSNDHFGSRPSSSKSKGTPPNRQPLELPHSQSASKGGCWTCRLRRKKCDENRNGDSCQTCIRLKIKCLGWGSKRPEWMRDKQAVEAYKADIKAQLTRAGLIRGQPRTSLLGASPPATANGSTPPMVPSHSHLASQNHSYTLHDIPGVSGPGPSLSHTELEPPHVGDFSFRYVEPHPLPGNLHLHLHPLQHHNNNSNGNSNINASSSSTSSSSPSTGSSGINNGNGNPFHPRLSGTSYNNNNSNSSLDLGPFAYTISNGSANGSLNITPISSNGDGLNFDFLPGVPGSAGAGNSSPFVNSPALANISPLPLPGQNSVQGEHVIYYFENVRRMQYIFAGNAITNITYQFILEDPTGPVSNAVCALASLHFSRMRIAHGFDVSEPDPEHSTAKYFHDEAWMQLSTAKQQRGRYQESEVVAALHLISYASFLGRRKSSGGVNVGAGEMVADGDWQQPLGLACEWLSQTGLTTDENPRQFMKTMTETSRWLVKAIMWLDIVSSVTLVRKPKYFDLYRYLLTAPASFWNDNSSSSSDVDSSLQMESICGYTDEALLGLAETAALAHWKSSEMRKGTLSVRELVRRGNEIEMRIQERQLGAGGSGVCFGDGGQVSLHPSLLGEGRQGAQQVNGAQWPSSDMRRMAADIYRQSVYLFLHTITSDCNPCVPEIRSTTDALAQLLFRLPYSDMDRALIFPICLAGCLTTESQTRQRLKQRLQQLEVDAPIGNLFPVCAVMDGVWQRRDSARVGADWRDVMRERGGSLLLV